MEPVTETVTVLVPADRAGKVVGKAGSGLKQIRESGCKLTMSPEPDASGSRRAEFSGSADQLGAGFHVLVQRAYFQELETQVALQVMIAPERAGTVIGKGGEHLKRVREMTSVNVQVEREPVTNPATGKPERAMKMQGEARYLGAALRVALSFGGIGGGAAPMAPVTVGVAPASVARPGGIALSQVRPISGDPEDMQLHMVIPGKYAGSVLGKEGVNVKRIASETGCRSITMTKRENNAAERRVIVLGNYMASVAAQQAIHALHAEAAGQDGISVEEVTVIYLLPRTAAGAVIGKAGAGLKGIREQSGVRKCDLARDEVEGQRPCTIQGPLHALLLAERLIQTAVQDSVVAGGAATFGGDDGLKRPVAAMSIGVPMEPVAKRARTDLGAVDNGSPVKLLVPAASAGAVIGKGGSGLKALRETHGVQIEMLPAAQAPHWPQDRVCILKGTTEGKQTATDSLLRMAFQNNEAACTLKMLVPATAAGAIIGKAGSMLKAIREHCGTQMKIERDDILGDRLVTATGPLANVSAGAAAVISVLGGTGPAAAGVADATAADAAFADGQPMAVEAAMAYY